MYIYAGNLKPTIVPMQVFDAHNSYLHVVYNVYNALLIIYRCRSIVFSNENCSSGIRLFFVVVELI